MNNINPEQIWIWLTTYSIKIVTALLVFLIGRWLCRHLAALLTKALEKNKMEQTLVKFLHNISYYAMLTAVIVAALSQLGINTTSFLTIIGAAGLAIGLALKDSLSNFSSGVMLVLFRPFKIGDFVETAGCKGTVKAISIFNTELATPDNQKVIIPNASVMGGVITNVTAHATRRIDLLIGVGYGDDLSKVKKALTAILANESRLLKDPAPTIAVAELADSSVNLVVRPWVKTEDYWTTRFDLIEAIKKDFDQKGISIPFPQRDVHLFEEKIDQ